MVHVKGGSAQRSHGVRDTCDKRHFDEGSILKNQTILVVMSYETQVTKAHMRWNVKESK